MSRFLVVSLEDLALDPAHGRRHGNLIQCIDRQPPSSPVLQPVAVPDVRLRRIEVPRPDPNRHPEMRKQVG
jgi:hypothetical protein